MIIAQEITPETHKTPHSRHLYMQEHIVRMPLSEQESVTSLNMSFSSINDTNNKDEQCWAIRARGDGVDLTYNSVPQAKLVKKTLKTLGIPLLSPKENQSYIKTLDMINNSFMMSNSDCECFESSHNLILGIKAYIYSLFDRINKKNITFCTYIKPNGDMIYAISSCTSTATSEALEKIKTYFILSLEADKNNKIKNLKTLSRDEFEKSTAPIMRYLKHDKDKYYLIDPKTLNNRNIKYLSIDKKSTKEITDPIAIRKSSNTMWVYFQGQKSNGTSQIHKSYTVGEYNNKEELSPIFTEEFNNNKTVDDVLKEYEITQMAFDYILSDMQNACSENIF